MTIRIVLFVVLFLLTASLALGLIWVPGAFTSVETLGLKVVVVMGCLACTLIACTNQVSPRTNVIQKG